MHNIFQNTIYSNMTATTDRTQIKLLEVREQIQRQLGARDKNLFNPLISPGPASITLLQNSSNSSKSASPKRMNFSVSSSLSSASSSSLNNHQNTNIIKNKLLFPPTENEIKISTSTNKNNNNNITSGPTGTTAINSIENEKKSSNNGNSNNNSRKGLVAAAALSLAVTRPLPSKRQQQQQQRHITTTTNHNHLRCCNNNDSNINVPLSYILPRQNNVITCHCGINDIIDNKFINQNNDLIQCDHCNRWQHIKCYGLKNKLEILPIKFYCNICQPKLLMKNYKISKKIIKKDKMNKINNIPKRETSVNSTSELNAARQLTKIRDLLTSESSIIGAQNNNISYRSIISSSSPNNHIPNNNNIILYKPQMDSRSSSVSSSISSSPTVTAISNTSTISTNSNHQSLNSSNTMNNSNNSNTDHNNNISENSSKKQSMYQDKYVKLFIQDHSNDDWVIQLNKKLSLLPQDDTLTFQQLNNSSSMSIFAKKSFKANEFIVEINGLVDFQKNYVVDPDNQYRIWGTTQPKVFFHPHWPLYLDARDNALSIVDKTGTPSYCNNQIITNLRKSCKPNVSLRTVKVPPSNNNDERQEDRIKFIITATKDISMGEELSIEWQWDLRHPICQIINDPQLLKNLNDMDKFWLVHSIDTIWQSCPCACPASLRDNCPLLKVKLFADEFHSNLKNKKLASPKLAKSA